MGSNKVSAAADILLSSSKISAKSRNAQIQLSRPTLFTDKSDEVFQEAKNLHTQEAEEPR